MADDELLRACEAAPKFGLNAKALILEAAALGDDEDGPLEPVRSAAEGARAVLVGSRAAAEAVGQSAWGHRSHGDEARQIVSFLCRNKRARKGFCDSRQRVSGSRDSRVAAHVAV